MTSTRQTVMNEWAGSETRSMAADAKLKIAVAVHITDAAMFAAVIEPLTRILLRTTKLPKRKKDRAKSVVENGLNRARRTFAKLGFNLTEAE